MLIRKITWRRELAKWLAIERSLPFEWGVHDCLTMVGDAIKAMTDQDVVADLRGTYHSADEVRDLLNTFGGMHAGITKVLGVEQLPYHCARVGDVVTFPRDESGMPLMGICYGSLCVFKSSSARGVEYLDLSVCDGSWAVGQSYG